MFPGLPLAVPLSGTEEGPPAFHHMSELLLPNAGDDYENKYLIFIKTGRLGSDRYCMLTADGIKKVFY